MPVFSLSFFLFRYALVVYLPGFEVVDPNPIFPRKSYAFNARFRKMQNRSRNIHCIIAKTHPHYAHQNKAGHR